ncbi:MAG TPA: AMP-binding protein, partial [Acidimicrobiales bacterium]|nr:AMP-binding protein [Acidimicrobiales bacterium]
MPPEGLITAADVVRARAGDTRVGLVFEGRHWTWAELVSHMESWAAWLGRLTPEGPPHIGVLLDNVPEYLFAFGGAALVGATVVGINHTRRGVHLLHDFSHTHCRLLISEPRHADLIDPIVDRLDAPVLMVGDTLESALGAVGSEDPGVD